MTEPIRIREIIAAMEAVAPPETAMEWDNVGLVFGDPAMRAKRVVACLDCSSEVLEQAGASGLVIVHHPPLFRPVRSLAATSFEGRLFTEAAKRDVAVYAAHTNFDLCDYSMGRACCEELELDNVRRIRPRPQAALDKLVTFVPTSHHMAVIEAMSAAGAGRIGDYINCAFSSPGLGCFQGLEGTNPAIGESGVLERVEELRIEMVCPRNVRDRVLAALEAVHPYEEVAFDLYPLAPVEDFHQVTWAGDYEESMTLAEAADHVRDALCDGADVRVVGDLDQPVQTVACATGSAAKKLHALRDVDLLITGDIDHHAALEAHECGLAVIAAGHFHTEKWFGSQVAALLAQRLPELNVPVYEANESSPFSLGV